MTASAPAVSRSTDTPTTLSPWWADAVIYQIYPRSFADGNADGMGDLPGVRSRLPYLRKLGVDAIWLSPFYVSPQADAGYDVADYRDVDPLFGTLADFDSMLAEAHESGMKVIVDLVPNHTSDEHEWFKSAKHAALDSPERDRYIFRDGKGAHGELPPNNWQSIFGGNAWTRLEDGQWYLHLFDTKQPDLNWDNPEVRAEMVSVLRFWLDRGVDGFRIDVAHGMVKAEGLPDWAEQTQMIDGGNSDKSDADLNQTPPYFDQPGVHEIYREWNRVLAQYDGDRMLVAEAWVEPAERLFRYVRHDEMQQAFNFDFLLAGWDAAQLTESITESLTEAGKVGAPSTWVMSNHDTVRHTSRFGLEDPTQFPKGLGTDHEQPDEALGLSRGRAAALVMLGLPGSAYIYQGDELGLPEHTTLPDGVREDPTFARTNGTEIGRDGCRVPLPWLAEAPGFGFGMYDAVSAPGAAPWLPQPTSFAGYAADTQVDVSGSTYELYRDALGLRRSHELGRGNLEWTPLNSPQEGVLSYRNGVVLVLANMGAATIELPNDHRVILASDGSAVDGGRLTTNASVWLVPLSS
ncbi:MULTISPECIES: glycoside hydrolase family 13 protein [unclassified Arthrobacter]|uniref:glycoside hydrolase family 13 protein n=1 Tax=unclassified Arthrobacter TaxID=235627 RepID=UPI0002D7D808|nr:MULTISPECIES: glycoside hydrolase family 13 protein [unclassified Arthrobacter]PVE18778.1 alpha-amylase [Arthrobacter sp. Bz4]